MGDEMIVRVAKALWCHDNPDSPSWQDMAWEDMGGSEPNDERIEYMLRAHSLAKAGLLAPAPLRKQVGTRFGGYVAEGRMNATYPFFWKGDPPTGENVRRYMTEWEPANG